MSTRLYVGRLPYRCSERDIERFFKGYGRIEDIIMKNGYAFVDMSDYRDADDAVHDLHGQDLNGERLSVEMARGTPRGRDRSWGRGERERGRSPTRRDRERDRTPPRKPRSYRISIENLSTRVTTGDLKDLFRKFGEVVYGKAHIRKDREGVVEIDSRTGAKKAIKELNGKEVEGRKIKVFSDEVDSSRSRSRSKSASRSRSRSRSKSKSRSRSSSAHSDRKAKADRKRSRSRSGSAASGRSRSGSPKDDQKKSNGVAHSPSPKRDRKDSEKSDRSDKSDD